ncbi:hypothetical protein LINPERPRIM_LOCUS26183, partial [Linum perenne]
MLRIPLSLGGVPMDVSRNRRVCLFDASIQLSNSRFRNPGETSDVSIALRSSLQS